MTTIIGIDLLPFNPFAGSNLVALVITELGALNLIVLPMLIGIQKIPVAWNLKQDKLS
jgi:hypothetical protein